MNQLEVLRESLGQCDEIILDALLMRNRIVEDIMVYKEANDLPVLQPEQEAKQKGWLEARMEGRRHKKEVNDVFASIIQNSKRIQSRNLFNYNIFLIGFMGAGKSTISDYLKNVLAMDVVEMDQCIVERQGMSISDIFETYGEEYFRELETNLLIEMQSRSNVVVSCGGGVPMRERNVAEMKKNGRVVLLTAKPETILFYDQQLFICLCLTKSVDQLLTDLKLTLSVCLNNYICCCLIFRATFFQQISDK